MVGMPQNLLQETVELRTSDRSSPSVRTWFLPGEMGVTLRNSIRHGRCKSAMVTRQSPCRRPPITAILPA